MFAAHVPGPLAVCGWRERRARTSMKARSLILSPILSMINAKHNDRRTFSGWCFSHRANAHLKGKEDPR